MKLVSDFALAVITIWQESRGEPQAGRQAVAEVIRHRMARRAAQRGRPATVAEIVLSPYQFSGFNTKDPNRILSFQLDDEDPSVKGCATAWLDSENSDITEGATHYLNPAVVVPLPSWALIYRQTVKIGAHQFYIE